MEAALFIQAIEKRQGLMVACPEEIAFRSGYITGNDLQRMAGGAQNNSYSAYLLQLTKEKIF